MTARTSLASPTTAAGIALLGALALATTLPATAQDTTEKADAVAAALPEGALAVVNGRPVPALSIDNIVRQIEAQGAQGGQGDQAGGAPDRERILDELIDLEILTQEAEKQKLDEQPEIAAALQLQYTQTMANAYLAAAGDAMEITEEDLRAEYDRQVANLDNAEYRASHILLESEEEARAVLDELAAGADFATLADERSSDQGGSNGGDLGWFQAGSMVPEFTAAVAAMEVGTISEAPVKSDFGYHVIRLDETRGAAPPEFEAVRPGLENLVLRDRLAAMVEELRAGADVER